MAISIQEHSQLLTSKVIDSFKEVQPVREGFSGLLLKPVKEFNTNELEDLLIDIGNKKGILRNIEFKDKFVTFKHSVNLVDLFLRVFKKIIKH